MMLNLSLVLMLGGQQPDTTLQTTFRVAAAIVLDSASAWARDIVPNATRLVVDRASFEAIAIGIEGKRGDWSGFSRALRATAEDRTMTQVKTCTGEIQPRCTLPAGTVVLTADGSRMRGVDRILTLTVWWPHRGLLGRVTYEATLTKGRVTGVRQTTRT